MDEEPTLTLDGVTFTLRELLTISFARRYKDLGQFGAPSHLYLTVIDKLATLIDSKGKYSFRNDYWSSTD